MIKKGNALYSESKEETTDYLKSILTDLIKLKIKMDKINKDWIGIDRSYEAMILRGGNKIRPIQTLLEYIFINLLENESDIETPLDKEHELYKKAISLWGDEKQVNMVFEELGELIIELSGVINFPPFEKLGKSLFSMSKMMRQKKVIGFTFEDRDLNHLAEEIADTEIMINQLKIIFDLNLLVHNWKFCKLKRLEDKINTNKTNLDVKPSNV